MIGRGWPLIAVSHMHSEMAGVCAGIFLGGGRGWGKCVTQQNTCNGIMCLPCFSQRLLQMLFRKHTDEMCSSASHRMCIWHSCQSLGTTTNSKMKNTAVNIEIHVLAERKKEAMYSALSYKITGDHWMTMSCDLTCWYVEDFHLAGRIRLWTA